MNWIERQRPSPTVRKTSYLVLAARSAERRGNPQDYVPIESDGEKERPGKGFGKNENLSVDESGNERVDRDRVSWKTLECPEFAVFFRTNVFFLWTKGL